jgi:hypothetical protein
MSRHQSAGHIFRKCGKVQIFGDVSNKSKSDHEETGCRINSGNADVSSPL